MKYAAKYFLKYLSLSLLVLTIATVSSAQTFDPIGTGVIGQQISSSVTPENPAPGQEVKISLSAYGLDLNSAAISWSVNGNKIQSGTGMTQFTLNAGKNGEVKRVVATITPTTGVTVTQSFTIAPQEVSIIYESDGYVPPFYKGKAVFAREGTVNLVAMPNLVSSTGVKLSPSTLTYKWIVDGTVQGSKSGYGRNSFSYTGSILGKDVIVEVEVSSATGNTKGKGIILLSPQDTEVLVYEKNPLYGTLFNRELSRNGLSLNGTETTIVAIPFSTSASSLSDGTLTYTWSINGSNIPVPKTQSFATFRNTTGQSGASNIGISVNNTTHLLQMMRNSLSINF